jgi:NhaP-type Na+/H+ or K+/H+ antiporter
VRLLGIGLPLTIALGALAAAVIFDRLSADEAVILAIVLAPTDAALGQAVVTEPRVPGRIRQGLNVESGLNDGICVPLLFAAVALADVEAEISEGRSAATLLLEEIGYGVVGGVVGGLWSRRSSSTPAAETSSQVSGGRRSRAPARRSPMGRPACSAARALSPSSSRE